MRGTLDAILKRFVCVGRLTVRWPDGRLSSYAGPADSGPSAGIAIADARTVRRLVLNPRLEVGEAYMAERLKPDGCSLYDVMEVLALNEMANAKGHPVARVRNALGVIRRRIDQYNPAHRARRNVAHHYDLNGRLYSLFLDRDRQYSCAYFPHGDETLEEAQIAKKRHIAAKLCLDRPGLTRPGHRVRLGRDGADPGARPWRAGNRHHAVAPSSWPRRARGLQPRGWRTACQFELLDYRMLDRNFDRIVSVGMFEHVGVGHYHEFFDTVARCLNPNGVALLHAIGRSDGPGFTNPWFAKYIFPGGYCPALSEMLLPVERSGLIATDIEVMRLHYAETLRHWRWRFAANRDTIASLYDERFCRMFEFYLCGSEIAFRHEGHMVFQIQLTRHQTAVPLTRDYITTFEAMSDRQKSSVMSRED